MEFCFCVFVVAVSAILAGYILYVLMQADVDTYQYSQFAIRRAAIKLIYRAIRYSRMGQLYIPEDLTYTAEGGVDSNCSLVISPKEHKIVFKGLRIDRANLKQYKALCEDRSPPGEVPVCYAETLFTKPLLAMMTSSKFCLSPVGLIHVRQTIKQWFPLHDCMTDTFTGEVTVAEYRKLERGIEVDAVLRLLTSTNLCVWEGVTTLLSRDRNAPKSARKQKAADPPITTRIPVSSSCGREYARVSGDWNLQHLYPWTSLLVGYPRQIAHGMWTLARAISELRVFGSKLSGCMMEVSCSFKTPLFMPKTVLLKTDNTNSAHHASGCRFLVENPDTGAPHVVGHVKLI